MYTKLSDGKATIRKHQREHDNNRATRPMLSGYAGGVAGAIVMVIVLVIVFPVLVMLGSGILAAVLGSSLKRNSDADNHTDDGPNEYLELSRKEAEIGYPET